MNESAPQAPPLEGIRVLELGSAILGPYTSEQLAEYGAEVIKVEPLEGDVTREMGPAREAGMGTLFMANNRGKRSIALNLKSAGARVALAKLVERSDVVIHNMRSKKAAKLGLDPKALLLANPRLIVAVLTGFRAGGAYSDDPAYDDIIQALSGLAGLSIAAGGDASYLPSAVADKTTANIATQAILAALFRRERTSRGGCVEVSMFETMASYVMLEHMGGQHFDPPAGPVGYARYLAKSHRPLRTSDGSVSVRPMTDAHWRSLFIGLDDEKAADDPRFSTFAGRAENIDEAFSCVESHTVHMSTSQCLSLLRRLDIPAAPINTLDQVLADPHLRDVGHYDVQHDPQMGAIRFAPLGPLFDGERCVPGLPPRLGEHSREVLADVGFTDAEIDELVATNDVAAR